MSYKSTLFYKLYHRPTGLFFRPTRGLDKNNLSKEGRAYGSKPSIHRVGNVFYNGHRNVEDVCAEDWEIHVYETILKEVIPCG